MSQQRQHFQMGGGGGQFGHGDTTFTKIFVGGLAWETQRETMRRYFEQFGEIQEAVVITDKNTGRSKGYGFVTFKDPESAMRACQNPSPVIDGRRANCNLASLGAQRPTRPSTPQHGMGRYRPASGSVGTAPPPPGAPYQGFHQPAQYAFPYGYSGYFQENMYPMNYYNVYGGQHFSPYYTPSASAAVSTPPAMYPNFYPFYGQYAQSGQTQNFGIQYPQMVQYPYLPQHYNAATGILSLVSTTTSTGITITSVAAGTGSSTTLQTAAAGNTEQSSSA